MRRMKLMGVWTAAMAIAAVTAGCGQADRTDSGAVRDGANRTGDAVRDGADRTDDAVRDGASRTGDAVRDGAGRAGDAVRDAGSAVSDAVLNGGRAADAAVETMDVKTALIADSRIDTGNINVDTDHQTKTVTLKGHVPTAAQRTFAEEVAVKKAVGYRVQNELTIS